MTTSIARTGGALGFATITDPALRGVLITTITLLLLSLACLVSALILRAQRLRREQRLAVLEATWRVLCHRAMVSDLPEELPELRPGDAPLFAQIWLDFLNRVRGDHVQRGLKHLARRIRLDHHLLRRLHSRRTDDRLLALLVLGRLQDSRVLPLAERCLDDSYPLLSLSAAQALMQVDAHRYTRIVLTAMAKHPWPLSRLRELLALAKPDWLQQETRAVLDSCDASHGQRILRVMADLGSSDIDAASSLLLSRFPDHDGILASVLTHTGNPSRHALALEALGHPAEAVRMAACVALTRIGLPRDRDILRARWTQETPALQSAIASTLMALPRMNEEEARAILADLSGSPTLSLIWLQEMLKHGWGEDLPFQHWMTVANA